MKWAVVGFPGSNDERDTLYALGSMGFDAQPVWHDDDDLKGCDAVVLPGGFSYGDYLRAGAVARFSPIMKAVSRHAAAGGPVMGICNGFQILCEAGLLPGALVMNSGLKFLCLDVEIEVVTNQSAFTCRASPGDSLTIPIKHGQGCYVVSKSDMEMLEGEDRIIFRYRDGAPNGSLGDIAGVAGPGGNVVGLMPHPEHAVDPQLGSDQGRVLFESAATWLAGAAASGVAK